MLRVELEILEVILGTALLGHYLVLDGSKFCNFQNQNWQGKDVSANQNGEVRGKWEWKLAMAGSERLTLPRRLVSCW